MFRFPLALAVLFLQQSAGGAEVSAVLPLVTETGFNRLSVNLAVKQGAITAQDTQQTNLTGALEVKFQMNPLTGKVSGISLEGGDLAFSNMSFNLRTTGFPVTVATASTTSLVGSPSTPVPPVPVDLPTGNFDSSGHVFTIKSGTLVSNGGGSSSSKDFAMEPLTAALSGTGSVVLTELPAMATSTTRTWSVRVTLPVNFTDTDMPDASTTITTTISGSLKGMANVTIGKTEFLAWTVENGQGTPAFNAPLREGEPFGLVWALGGAPGDSIKPRLPVVVPGTPAPMATIDLSTGATIAPVTVEVSENLSSWIKAPLTSLDTAANPLPAGFQGTVTVQLGAMERFVRLSATEP